MPVLTPDGQLLAVLDVDSGRPGAGLHYSSADRVVRLPSCRPCPSNAAQLAARCQLYVRPFCPTAPPADLPAAFTTVDAEWLERLCANLGARQWLAGL